MIPGHYPLSKRKPKLPVVEMKWRQEYLRYEVTVDGLVVFVSPDLDKASEIAMQHKGRPPERDAQDRAIKRAIR